VAASEPVSETPAKAKAAPKVKAVKAPAKKAPKPPVDAPAEAGEVKVTEPKPKVTRVKKAKAE
jgi:hypothetical protein